VWLRGSKPAPVVTVVSTSTRAENYTTRNLPNISETVIGTHSSMDGPVAFPRGVPSYKKWQLPPQHSIMRIARTRRAAAKPRLDGARWAALTPATSHR
jgi:hypothetical protein